MKKFTSLSSIALSVVATFLLSMGFGSAASRIDPVAFKAKSIDSSELGQVSSLPCMGCTGGGDGDDDGDPVDRTSSSRELA